jgi:hypothetical protein
VSSVAEEKVDSTRALIRQLGKIKLRLKYEYGIHPLKSRSLITKLFYGHYFSLYTVNLINPQAVTQIISLLVIFKT